MSFVSAGAVRIGYCVYDFVSYRRTSVAPTSSAVCADRPAPSGVALPGSGLPPLSALWRVVARALGVQFPARGACGVVDRRGRWPDGTQTANLGRAGCGRHARPRPGRFRAAIPPGLPRRSAEFASSQFAQSGGVVDFFDKADKAFCDMSRATTRFAHACRNPRNTQRLTFHARIEVIRTIRGTPKAAMAISMSDQAEAAWCCSRGHSCRYSGVSRQKPGGNSGRGGGACSQSSLALVVAKYQRSNAANAKTAHPMIQKSDATIQTLKRPLR